MFKFTVTKVKNGFVLTAVSEVMDEKGEVKFTKEDRYVFNKPPALVAALREVVPEMKDQSDETYVPF